MNVLWMIRAACLLGLVVLSVLITASSMEMSLLAGLRATVDSRWGVTTMVDLYLGLFAVAGWIAHRERSVPRSLLWLVGLCLLGNFTTLVYLLLASWRAQTVEDLWRPVR